MNVGEVTKKERAAIEKLRRVAKSWPASLCLFSWSGTLCIIKNYNQPGKEIVIAYIDGIVNDGGDPSDVYQPSEDDLI